jgi:hypothetical protein
MLAKANISPNAVVCNVLREKRELAMLLVELQATIA